MQILPSHASNHDSPESKSIPFYRNIQGKHEDPDLTVRVYGLIRVLVFLLAWTKLCNTGNNVDFA